MICKNNYDKVLNMPQVFSMPGFWIYMCSQYASASQCARVLNIPGFWICFWFSICYASEYARFTQGPEYAWIILEYMPDCARICLNMSEYVWTCLKLPKWFLFYMSLLKSLVCLNMWLLISTKFIIWRNMKLFSWRDKFSFFL